MWKSVNKGRNSSGQKSILALLLVAGTFCILTLASCSQDDQPITNTFEEKDVNVILIGWDGNEPEVTFSLLEQNKLPNLAALVEQGSLLQGIIGEGKTETKPGWSQILSGYDTTLLGVFSNKDYRPIPKGLTVFERLDQHFGKKNIATIFIAGKVNNLGFRGPHELCINCQLRELDTRLKTGWWEENTTAQTIRGEAPRYEHRDGEPYYLLAQNVDFFRTALTNASVVGPLALEQLKEHKDDRYFMFIHFEEPDEMGHIYTASSIQYSQSIIENDLWLGEIVQLLKSQGNYEKTIIIVTTDHGFEMDGYGHQNNPNLFLATNYKALRPGLFDRRDIAPTLLDMYGIDPLSITPSMDGSSLVVS